MERADMLGRKQPSLIMMLVCLTLLSIVTQLAFFFIHYKVGDIVDSLANTSIIRALFHPTILLPVLGFIFIQLAVYSLFIAWVWFLAISLGEWFVLSNKSIYWLGILFWLLGCLMIFSLNAYYFPNSFFAEPVNNYLHKRADLVAFSLAAILFIATIIAYCHCFWFKRHQAMASLFIFSIVFFVGGGFFSNKNALNNHAQKEKPNIIIIGLDSLRPDYVISLQRQPIHTPNIDKFLKTATIFTNAYTPLGRTFPSWVSILTGKYPLHNHARMNLANPAGIAANDTLAKNLKAHGYLTIYGTDETRFTDITSAYGFDRIIGPKGGAVEFLLGGLSDFPLTNLLINLPSGRFLFPYNYGNRAAEITYEPDKFLQLVKEGLSNRPKQPVFLAIHLCLSHWPFRWARDGQADNLSVPNRYKSSIEAIDVQFGGLMQILQQAGLLDNSLVVLLSDHGVTLGMPDDRFINEKNYRGDSKKIHAVSTYKLASAPDFTLDIKHHFVINTSYGQGTDVLSLKQNHILLAFSDYGTKLPAKKISELSSVLNVAPTILDYLHYPSLQKTDDISLLPLVTNKVAKLPQRAFFIETGDKITEIESNEIFVEKVVKKTIGAYSVNTKSGLLILAKEAEQSIIGNKQRAILWGDWLLALYPAEMHYKAIANPKVKKPTVLKPFKVPAYYVLVNLKTGLWTVDLDSPFAKTAPVRELLRRFKNFYGKEV